MHRGEERLDELLLLAVEVLANALGHGHRRAFQLQDAQGDAIDVEHEVGPPGVLPEDSHLLGDSEVVVSGGRPVDQRNRDELLAGSRLDIHAVSQQAVDLAVGFVEGLAASERRGLVQLEQRLGNDPVAVTLAPQPAAEAGLLDVAVFPLVLPVGEIGVAEGVPEELHHPFLRLDFPFADSAHVRGLPGSTAATAALPLSVSRYCWSRLRGLSGIVYAILPSATSSRITLLS